MMSNKLLSTFLFGNLFLFKFAFCLEFSQHENRTSDDTSFNKTQFVQRQKNGSLATLTDVPYLVALKRDMKIQSHPGYYFTFCGGTLIKPSKVLTAAHCFIEQRLYFGFIRKNSKRSLSKVIAVMGCIENGVLESTSSNGQLRIPKIIKIPKNYFFPHKDIAVLLMNKPFQLNDHVKTIYFARSFKHYEGTCLIAGFGYITSTTGEKGLPADLYLGQTELMSAAECSKRMQSDAPGLICAMSTPSDTTKGDSGGPLVCKGTKEKDEDPNMGILVGIVSGQYEFSFYTRVSNYIKFIDRAISQT